MKDSLDDYDEDIAMEEEPRRASDKMSPPPASQPMREKEMDRKRWMNHLFQVKYP